MFYSNRQNITGGAVFALVLAIILAACAPAPAASTNISTSPNLDAATKEGKVNVYTSMSQDNLDTLMSAFKKKHPDIEVDTWRDSSAPIAQKALTEFRANTAAADVIEVSEAEAASLLNAGVYGQYKSLETKAYPAGLFDADGYYATERINLVVIAYNTNMVNTDDAPKKLEDLLDPKWTASIAVEHEDWPLIAYTRNVMGEAKANDFWTKLGAQKVRVITGHTQIANALAAGEFAVSPNLYAYRVESLKAKKASIEWVKTDPVYVSVETIAIAKNPPHPNAAKVWIDWILSAEGQEAIVTAGLFPARPGIKTNPEGILEGLSVFYGNPRLLQKRDELQGMYYKLFGIK